MAVSLTQDLSSTTRPYHVGRARARGQLSRALETQNEAAQLRRLQQCLQSPATQYEDGGSRAVEEASEQVVALAQRIGAIQATAKAEAPLDTSDYFQSPRRKEKPQTQPKAAVQPAQQAPAPAAASEVPVAPPALVANTGASEADAAVADADAAAAEEDLEKAALKIQSRLRGNQDRASVLQVRQEVKQAKETEQAVTKIQAVYRGNTTRKSLHGQEAVPAAADGDDVVGGDDN